MLAGGKGLGGSTKINAMLYARGLPAEYNAWSQDGRVGWSYDELQPYFIKSETDLDQLNSASENKDFHGTKGPWKNRSHKATHWAHTLPIIKASSALGIKCIDDLNSPLHPPQCCAKMHFTITQNGERCSTLTAFLPNTLVRERSKHLHVCIRTAVLKIDLSAKEKDGSGFSAAGVFLQNEIGKGPVRNIKARKEVILCAGPIGSPHILMLSGVGPKKHLKEHLIHVKKDLPGVGSHLQDHLMARVTYFSPISDSLLKLRIRPWVFFKHLILYIFFGMGLLLAPVLEVVIFLQSRLLDNDFNTVISSPEDLDASLPKNLPDIEVMPIPIGDINESPSFWASLWEGCFSLYPILVRPTSLGTVRLASSDPRTAPIVNPNYLSTPDDRLLMRKGVQYVARLKQEMASHGYPHLKEAYRHHPLSPSDKDIDEFIRSKALTTFHYTSTCRMAPEDDGISPGVVDDRLRVHGIGKLRVADSSVFPRILSTHTQAATVVVAEKCADMVKEDNQRMEF